MNKIDRLYEYIKSCKKVAVAFSGGVDSSFLLKASCEALGRENVLAVTVLSSVISEEERQDAAELAKSIAVQHEVLEFDVFSIPGFKENPVDRCYICKKQIFNAISNIAAAYRINTVVDGTNADDSGDYRPGMKALEELGIKSPLKLCGIGKREIREASRKLELFTWSRPSMACLASRIPYNEEITEAKLRMVEKAEAVLRSMGFSQHRVRCHGTIARIELLPSEMGRILDEDKLSIINEGFKSIGFDYVTLDLKGYRTGSLNETILKKEV
ncbi:MAG: ATP-dependent sacrificial sulfur transferase LarE [Bacillota bacterium]